MMNNFKINDYCVYRTHGVAKIIDIENIKIGDFESKCFVLYFDKEKLTLKVPYKYKNSTDIRPISTQEDIEKIFKILRDTPKKMKGMWNKRAQEYEDKINAGNIFDIADVLQDLVRDIEDSERSFSERIIYETALYRISQEVAIIKKITIDEAEKLVLNIAKDKVDFVDIAEKKEA